MTLRYRDNHRGAPGALWRHPITAALERNATDTRARSPDGVPARSALGPQYADRHVLSISARRWAA